MTKLILPSGSSPRGAQMGRPNELPADPTAPIRLRLTALRWVSGDYDQWGAYWGGGSGDRVYCAWGDDVAWPVRVFVRGATRYTAKAATRETLPKARFYR